MLLLTGQRRSEAGGMAWAEISLDLDDPCTPHQERGDSYRPAICAGAGTVAYPIRRLVFPGIRGPFSNWSEAKAALNARSGVTDWRLHDLRRTMATGLQRLGVRLEVREQVLNHISGSRARIVGIYQRHDFATEKRAALEAWGEHVMAIVEGRVAASNVTELKSLRG